MADRVDIKLKATDSAGANTNTTISYVNPEASNSDMKSFAQRLNALTRNTYKQSDKIETTVLDNAPDSQRVTPNLSLSTNTITKTALLADPETVGQIKLKFKADLATITYNGDGDLYIRLDQEGWFAPFISIANQEKLLGFFAYYPQSAWDQVFTAPLTIKVCSTATDHYHAAETTFTVTA